MESELFDFIAGYMPLTEPEKQVIVDMALFKRVDKGTFLVREGELSNAYYFVVRGCLRTYYMIDGEEKTTAFYTELQNLAPLSTVNKTPSDQYIVCVEDSLLLVSTLDTEQLVFERFPRFETLCRLLSENLLAQNQASFDQFKNSSPEQRYLRLLDTRPDLMQRVPLHQLASYLGIKAESLSRIRRRVQQKART
ncbi:MAG: Crp/Fnr family transcriptional regulator [Spirosoma sp.]|nr:Crp/Fnr family transcriptional regulator [Spirosoma sp.]